VPINGDRWLESAETFRTSIFIDPGAGPALVARRDGIGTITDDDRASAAPQISLQNLTMLEGHGAGFARVRVRLAAATLVPTTVQYVTVEGSAKPGGGTTPGDYTHAMGVVTIPARQTFTDIIVRIRGNAVFEPDKSFSVKLLNTTQGAIVVDTATVTLRNDDPAPIVLPTISVADASLLEGNSGTRPLTFTVTLSSAALAPVSVNYAFVAGTATAGSDFRATQGRLMFRPGQTTAVVTAIVAGDVWNEADETFRIVLSAPSGATLATTFATGTIRNDDPPSAAMAAAFASLGGGLGTTPVSLRRR